MKPHAISKRMRKHPGAAKRHLADPVNYGSRSQTRGNAKPLIVVCWFLRLTKLINQPIKSRVLSSFEWEN